jgi:hypothetical protein
LISEPSLPEKLSSSSEPTLERAVQERIGDHLRAMYDDLMQQPVPDRFAELLSRLETKGEKADQ